MKKTENDIFKIDLTRHITKLFGQQMKKVEQIIDERFDKHIKEINENINMKFKRMQDYIEFKLEPLEEFRNSKNEIFDKLDWLIGAYKKFDEEHSVLSNQEKEITDKIDDHEKRISDLEEKKFN